MGVVPLGPRLDGRRRGFRGRRGRGVGVGRFGGLGRGRWIGRFDRCVDGGWRWCRYHHRVEHVDHDMAVDPHFPQRGAGRDGNLGLSGGDFQRPHITRCGGRRLECRVIGECDGDGVAISVEFVARVAGDVEDDTPVPRVIAGSDGGCRRGFGAGRRTEEKGGDQEENTPSPLADEGRGQGVFFPISHHFNRSSPSACRCRIDPWPVAAVAGR